MKFTMPGPPPDPLPHPVHPTLALPHPTQNPGPPHRSRHGAIPRAAGLAGTSVTSHHWPLWVPQGARRR